MKKGSENRTRTKRSMAGVLLPLILMFGAGLILLNLFVATSRLADETAVLDEIVLGTPLQVAFPTRTVQDLSQLPRGEVAHVDVVYFYRTPRCSACINAGQFARETVTTFFASQLKSGGMSFQELDMERPQNAAVSSKYDTAGSALYVSVLIDRVEYLCPIGDIWFYTNDKPLFLAMLKDKLDMALGGM